MAQFIVFGNQKGGIGKTTLAVLTATGLSRPPFSRRVLLIDNDNQRSALRLRQYDTENYPDQPMPYPIVAMTYPEIVQEIEAIDQEYDYVFIDTPGRLDANLPPEQQEVTKILLLTDYLFMPFKAGALNLDATTDYVRVLLKAQQHRAHSERPLAAYGVVNFFKSRSRINDELQDEVQYLQQNAGLNFMRTALRQYVAFEYIDTCQSLYDPSSSDAATQNFTAFLDEFLTLTK